MTYANCLKPYAAVWGGADGNAAGVLSEHDTREEAEAAAAAWNAANDNPACGAWVVGTEGRP